LPSNPAVKANTYANTVAKLRSSNTLPQEERDYLKKRSAKVKVALESLLGKKLNGKYIPKIAFIASGGGARAMLSTVGWHDGADEVGLLDALTYDVGLSGGTWGIGYWLSSGMTPRNFQNTLKTQMTFGILPVKGLESGTIFPTGEESKMILEAMLAKLSYDQPVGLVDFYGGLLANRFLDYLAGQRHVFALHDLRARIANGDVPMPIFTAINADDGTHEKNRHLVRWIEFTPYEVGASWLGGFVPSWGYGRRFVDNQSVDFSPPQSFGFQTGTYGSAFAFDFRRGVEEVLTTAFKNPVIVAGVTKLIEKLANPSAAEFGQTRLSTASVNNFAIDAPGADEDIRDKEHLRFADGGLAFNLPYPPVSGERPERMADVMIFLDASGSLESHGSQEFKLATDYAAAKGLKFPKVTIKDLEKKPISVFMDTNDPSTPVVIYLPRKLKETSMPTLKFVYSAEDFEKMIRLTSGQMRDAATQIIDAIRRNIELNKGF
jgi:phospholipase A2